MIQVRGLSGVIAALVLAGIAAGCSGPTPVRPLPEEARVLLRGGSVRVLAIHPGKRIVQYELVYKFLWNDHNFRSFATEGLWDPGPTMEKQMTTALRARAGFVGTPLREHLEAGAFTEFHKAADEGVSKDVRDVGLNSLLQPVEAPYRSLRAGGTEYLLEFILEDVTIACNTCFPSRFGIDVIGRLIRISDGAVIWAEKAGSSVSIPGLTYFSDLEKNDFALLKDRLDESLKVLLSPSHPFLRGLALPD